MKTKKVKGFNQFEDEKITLVKQWYSTVETKEQNVWMSVDGSAKLLAAEMNVISANERFDVQNLDLKKSLMNLVDYDLQTSYVINIVDVLISECGSKNYYACFGYLNNDSTNRIFVEMTIYDDNEIDAYIETVTFIDKKP